MRSEPKHVGESFGIPLARRHTFAPATNTRSRWRRAAEIGPSWHTYQSVNVGFATGTARPAPLFDALLHHHEDLRYGQRRGRRSWLTPVPHKTAIFAGFPLANMHLSCAPVLEMARNHSRLGLSLVPYAMHIYRTQPRGLSSWFLNSAPSVHMPTTSCITGKSWAFLYFHTTVQFVMPTVLATEL